MLQGHAHTPLYGVIRITVSIGFFRTPVWYAVLILDDYPAVDVLDEFSKWLTA
jgi:hypothetical protein